jgi:membrane protease YdiL (CAAX protease family)
MASDTPAGEPELGQVITPGRGAQAAEVGVFLFLIVPSMVLSLFITRQGGLGFVPTAVMIIIRDVSLVTLILYFIWRNRESVARLGWVFDGFGREVLIGTGLFVPMFVATSLLDSALQSAGFSAPATPTPAFLTVRGPNEVLLALALVAVVAVSEETIFRGYLLLRLRSLITTAPAILLSSFIFSLGHGYEGASGLTTVGVMGAILAIVYVWRGTLVAPITMHFLQDFFSIILLPQLMNAPVGK